MGYEKKNAPNEMFWFCRHLNILYNLGCFNWSEGEFLTVRGQQTSTTSSEKKVSCIRRVLIDGVTQRVCKALFVHITYCIGLIPVWCELNFLVSDTGFLRPGPIVFWCPRLYYTYLCITLCQTSYNTIFYNLRFHTIGSLHTF